LPLFSANLCEFGDKLAIFQEVVTVKANWYSNSLLLVIERHRMALNLTGVRQIRTDVVYATARRPTP
jgi:hypothetical protein